MADNDLTKEKLEIAMLDEDSLKAREEVWRYTQLRAPHYLPNGLENVWDVSFSVSHVKDYKRLHYPGTIDQSANVIHVCFTARHAVEANTKFAAIDGPNSKPYNIQPFCIAVPFGGIGLTDSAIARNMVPHHIVRDMAGQWAQVFLPCCNRHKKAGKTSDVYSGSQHPEPAFRPAKLVFEDVTVAIACKDKKRATAFDVDEVYFAKVKEQKDGHPVDVYNSQVFDACWNSREANKLKERHHYHLKGQPLVFCGAKGCNVVGVSVSGLVKLPLLKRCAACAVVH